MSMRHYINNGQTISDKMSWDWDGASIYVLFFDGAGDPATVSGVPAIYRSIYDAGDLWQPVQPFDNGEWRANGPISRVRIDLAGVTGYTTYQVVIWRTDDPVTLIPDGAFTGRRAMTTQAYDEVNKKTGTQWEASTRVQLAAATGVNYTIFRTGNKSVDLKQRIFGFDGLGVVGRIYRNPTYTGGTPAGFWNMLTSKALVQPECQLFVQPTVTARGTEIATAVYAFGPASQQGRGSVPAAYASNRIFDEPNTTYLLVIETLDDQLQYVSSRLELYEGGLDLPLRA
jgi:hypothetical protein